MVRLTGGLLNLLEPQDHLVVRSRLPRLAADAATWAGPVDHLLGTTLYHRLAVSVATIAPGLGYQDVLLLLKYSLWTFLLDGRLDEGDPTPTALAEVRGTVDALLARDRAPSPGDFFETVLADLIDEFHRRDSGGALFAAFRRSLAESVTADVEHILLGRRVAAGQADPPSGAEYLELAGRHVNYGSFVFALLTMRGQTPDPDTLHHVAESLPAACRAVRLANDLATVRKDVRERNLNILLLRDRDGTPNTPASVTAEIRRQCRLHLAALAGIRSPAGAGVRTALRHALRVSITLYQITDLRFDLDRDFDPDPNPDKETAPR